MHVQVEGKENERWETIEKNNWKKEEKQQIGCFSWMKKKRQRERKKDKERTTSFSLSKGCR